MVLHNSKWDRKATRNYQRKHGIKPAIAKVDEVEQVEQVQDSEHGEGSEEDIEGHRTQLESNDWRYQEVGSSIPVDDRPLDVDFNKLTFKDYSDFERRKMDFSKMSESELLEWSLQGTPKEDKGHIRELNQSEMDEWNKMKDKAASVKLQNEMKMKFSGEKKKPKVLELSLSGDEDNYRSLVDRNFGNAVHLEHFSDTELEGDLLELMGEEKDEQSLVDIDDLMNAPVEKKTIQRSSVPVTNKVDPTESQKFLDDLLD